MVLGSCFNLARVGILGWWKFLGEIGTFFIYDDISHTLYSVCTLLSSLIDIGTEERADR